MCIILYWLCWGLHCAAVNTPPQLSSHVLLAPLVVYYLPAETHQETMIKCFFNYKGIPQGLSHYHTLLGLFICGSCTSSKNAFIAS